MKYIVYLTINKINNKVYIGVHKTENPEIFDGYLGCGAYTNKPSSYNKTNYHLHNAILKYGPNNFYRVILKVFDTPEEAFALEAKLVTKEFISRPDTYNMILGGYIPPITAKTIYQFDIQGNLIKTWESIKSIVEFYNCNKDRITMCIKDKRSFDNSYWSEQNSISVNSYRISSRDAVFQYNSNGLLLNSFKNITEASQKLDLDAKAITTAVFEKHKCAGYYFLHADTTIESVLESINNRKKLNQVKVYRYLSTKEFDSEYESISEAARKNNTSTGNIIRAIKSERLCSGYRWSYEKNNTIHSYTERNLTPVKIAQYDKSGNLIKIWNTVSECQKEFPACRKVCNGTRKSTNGFVFKYVD